MENEYLDIIISKLPDVKTYPEDFIIKTKTIKPDFTSDIRPTYFENITYRFIKNKNGDAWVFDRVI